MYLHKKRQGSQVKDAQEAQGQQGVPDQSKIWRNHIRGHAGIVHRKTQRSKDKKYQWPFDNVQRSWDFQLLDSNAEIYHFGINEEQLFFVWDLFIQLVANRCFLPDGSRTDGQRGWSDSDYGIAELLGYRDKDHLLGCEWKAKGSLWSYPTWKRKAWRY